MKIWHVGFLLAAVLRILTWNQNQSSSVNLSQDELVEALKNTQSTEGKELAKAFEKIVETQSPKFDRKPATQIAEVSLRPDSISSVLNPNEEFKNRYLSFEKALDKTKSPQEILDASWKILSESDEQWVLQFTLETVLSRIDNKEDLENFMRDILSREISLRSRSIILLQMKLRREDVYNELAQSQTLEFPEMPIQMGPILLPPKN